MNPVEAQRVAAIRRDIAALPPHVRAAVGPEAIAEARSVLPIPYWSTVRIAGTVAANVLTVDTTSRKAFQYAVGQDMAIAGRAGTAAQYADTNLLRSGETLDNASVWIYGIAAELCSNSDPRLAADLWRECSVELSLNGSQSFKLGTLAMFPSAGGLYGVGQSNLVLPPDNVTGQAADGGPGAAFGSASNGNPMSVNFLKFPQAFKWCGVGSNERDASLSVIVTPNRAITIPLAASRPAAAGTGAWTQPATGDRGTFVDIRFRLISTSISKLSQNT